MLETIKKYIADFSASKWSEYKAALMPDATYEEFATGTRVKGADDVVKAAQKWKRAFPDARGSLLSTTVSGDTVVAEIHWEGTHTGPLEGPTGTISPTGKRASVKAIEVFRVRNDKITETRHYFDLLTILNQLGVAPMAGTGQTGAGATQQPPTRHP